MSGGFSVITYALCKKYTNKEIAKVISSFSEGMTFKGTVSTQDDLPSLANNGDLYIVKDQKCKAVFFNGEWALFDEIPTKVSKLINDVGYITEAALAGLATKKELAAYYNKAEVDEKLKDIADEIPDVSGFATKDALKVVDDKIQSLATKEALREVESKIPAKTSQLVNDSGFITEHQSLDGYATEEWVESKNYLTEHQSLDAYRKASEQDAIDNNKQDKLIAGKNISIIDNVISSTGGDCKMGRSFVTKVTVGNLLQGTSISENDSVANILYRILYGEVGSTISLYYGASDNIPTSRAGLTEIKDQEVDVLIQNGKLVKIITGNLETEEGQHPVFACDKGARLISVKQWKDASDTFSIEFNTIDKGDYYLYYLDDLTYDVDLGGTTYKFIFQEG